MIDDIERKDELMDRAARALSALPAANPLATARIMTRVRARMAMRPSAWRRTVESASAWLNETRLTPAAAGLLAAASLMIGFVVRDTMTPADESAAVSASAPVTGSVPVEPAAANSREPGTVAVPLVFESRTARSVAVVGDFNGWDPTAAPMQRFGTDGPWTATIPARPGRHTYAFLVDGATLVADPRAARAKSLDYGGDASVLMVRFP